MQTEKGAKLDHNVILEGPQSIMCPTCSLYMSFINYGSCDENQYLAIQLKLRSYLVKEYEILIVLL